MRLPSRFCTAAAVFTAWLLAGASIPVLARAQGAIQGGPASAITQSPALSTSGAVTTAGGAAPAPAPPSAAPAVAPGSDGAAHQLAPPAPASPVPPGAVDTQALLLRPAALVQWVRTHHPDALAADAAVRAAHAERRVSRVYPNPQLVLNANGFVPGRVQPPAASYLDPINLGAGLQETFEIGKRGPRSAAADLRAEEAGASRGDVLLQRVADARDALARVLYLEQRQSILEERVRAAHQMIALESVRLQHGDISGTDLDRLRLDTAAVERAAADNRADRDAALGDCSTALAAPCSTRGDESVLDAAAQLPAQLPRGELTAAQQPAVRAFELEHDAALEDARLWRHHVIPDPTVGVSYTRDFYKASGAQGDTLGVFASIPLPFFDTGGPQADASTAQALQAHEQAVALENRFRADARALLARKVTLDQTLQRLERTLLPLSSSVVKSAELAFNAGQLSLTDFLLARRDYSALLLDRIDTRYASFSVRNQLRRVLGLDARLVSP